MAQRGHADQAAMHKGARGNHSGGAVGTKSDHIVLSSMRRAKMAASGLPAGNADARQDEVSSEDNGEVWRDPGPTEQLGGSWLVGKRVKVFWEDDQRWNSAMVMKFQPKAAFDSHGQYGPLHFLRYTDGEFSEVFDENTKWRIQRHQVPLGKKNSAVKASAVHDRAGRNGAVASASSGGGLQAVGPEQSKASDNSADEGLAGPAGEQEERIDRKRNRQRKLSIRMREAVLDLTDDSDDDFRCEIQTMRNRHLGLREEGKTRKRQRSTGEKASLPRKERRPAPLFAGLPVPIDFLEDSPDPLFVGCHVEVKIDATGDWIRARYLAKAQCSQKSVRVVSADGEEFAEPFDFYPWERLTELGCIMGRGGNIRIPMRDEDWQDVGAGRHVRVAFKDGEDGIKHYLGVIAYETVSKGWHVFFEDDEEIDIKVPAEDAIPVPVDCSEWLATLGYSWWGHQYAARLRDGAEAARRPLKEMKQIVEDRLHRSSSNAFTARLPPKDQRRAARDAANSSLLNVRQRHAIAGKSSNLSRSTRAKLAILRKREDKSKVGWDQLCGAIQAHGGLNDVDEKQCWGQIMEDLRVDPAKIGHDSCHTLRTWYVEKKARKMSKKARMLSGKRQHCEESRDAEQPSRLPRESLDGRPGLETEVVDCDRDTQEDDVPLRPRKLTARLYQQHIKNLRDLFSPSLLGSTIGEPRWRACALSGNPCLRRCNCQWTTLSNSSVSGQSASHVREESASCLGDSSQKTFARDEFVDNRYADINDGSAETSGSVSAADAARVFGQKPLDSMSAWSSPLCGATNESEASESALHSENGALQEAEKMSNVGNRSSSSVAKHRGLEHIGEWANNESKNPDSILTFGRSSTEARRAGISNGCIRSQNQDIDLASKASILARWWRRLNCQRVPDVSANSASAPHADDREVKEKTLQVMASIADESKALNQYACSAFRDKHESPKLLAQCPGCSKDFTQWVNQHRAALAKRHMQKCCPHLLSDTPVAPKKARLDAQKASGVPLTLAAEQDGIAETEPADCAFADPFAAYRCCGRTFLRTQDLERHWARQHKCGVVACHGGYADPCNLTRKMINQLGLGVKLVAPVQRSHENLEAGGGRQEAGKAVLLEKTTADITARGEPCASRVSKTSPMPGMGKGGRVWLPQRRPPSACANDVDWESDDSIDIVLR